MWLTIDTHNLIYCKTNYKNNVTKVIQFSVKSPISLLELIGSSYVLNVSLKIRFFWIGYWIKFWYAALTSKMVFYNITKGSFLLCYQCGKPFIGIHI